MLRINKPPLRILLAANTIETEKIVKYLPQNATWVQGKLIEDFRVAFKNTWDTIIVSDCLPALTTTQKLNFFRKACPETPIICVIKQFKAEKIIQAIRSGATDIVEEAHLETLSGTILEMTNRLKEHTNYHLDHVRQERDFLIEVMAKIRSSLDLATAFETATQEVRAYLQADRVVIYQFDLDFKGTIVAESVGESWSKAMGSEVNDTCFQETRASSYTKNRILAINNIYTAGLSTCHLQLLERFQVKANLVVPIFLEDQVWGLLIAHQCDEPRVWLEPRINWMMQVASQLAITIQQETLQQKNHAKILELERISQLKDDFLATVAHELRTPMSNIHMAIHMLKSAALPEPLSGYVDILFGECKREVALINNLLDLQHLEANTQSLSYQEVSLPLWLPILVAPFIERTRQKKQKFNTEILSPLSSVSLEISSVESILVELLNNACKYTPAGKQITLQVAQETASLQFALANTGVEIPAHDLPRIFDKFYRVTHKGSLEQVGTGLGLALVKQLVKRLNGEIWVVSGNATTVFHLSIPLSTQL